MIEAASSGTAARESRDEKVKRLRTYLQQHPGTRLQDLPGDLENLAKWMLERNALRNIPGVRIYYTQSSRMRLVIQERGF